MNGPGADGVTGVPAFRDLRPSVAQTPPPGAKTMRIRPAGRAPGLWAPGFAPYNHPQRKYLG